MFRYFAIALVLSFVFLTTLKVRMPSTVKRVTKRCSFILFAVLPLNRCRLVGTCHDWLCSPNESRQRCSFIDFSVVRSKKNAYFSAVTTLRGLVPNKPAYPRLQRLQYKREWQLGGTPLIDEIICDIGKQISR